MSCNVYFYNNETQEDLSDSVFLGVGNRNRSGSRTPWGSISGDCIKTVAEIKNDIPVWIAMVKESYSDFKELRDYLDEALPKIMENLDKLPQDLEIYIDIG